MEDATSAIRWLRMNARRLGIDTGRVIAGGGSSGGSMAAFAAYRTGFESDSEDKAMSSKPDALVLINPALGFPEHSPLTPEQREAAKGPLGKLIASWKVTKGGPPAILFYGTKDSFLEKGLDFTRQLIAAGIRGELYTAAGQQHAFYNRSESSPWHVLVLRQIDLFLSGLGYVKGNPTVTVPANGTEKLDKAEL